MILYFRLLYFLQNGFLYLYIQSCSNLYSCHVSAIFFHAPDYQFLYDGGIQIVLKSWCNFKYFQQMKLCLTTYHFNTIVIHCVCRNHFGFINAQIFWCNLKTISNLIFCHLTTLWKLKHKRPLDVTSKFQYMHIFMHLSDDIKDCMKVIV